MHTLILMRITKTV